MIFEEALFAVARKLPVQERVTYLHEACLGDDLLRKRLEALLSVHDDPAALEEPVIRGESFGSISEGIIGRYKILEKIGEGGCGEVFVAEQSEPVQRHVALKLIKLGMDSKAVVARFELERQALACMEHPGIAKVWDGGTTTSGRPYFVMELVTGMKITDHFQLYRVPTRERIQLFVSVVQAVRHAHQKGIIHRDLKPSNILVTIQDGNPVPKVIDFGIAKAINGESSTARTVLTALNHFIGTPTHASPEQAVSGGVVDERTDIFSLGVVLYEALTGSTPLDPNELQRVGFDRMIRLICEEEPKRPSQHLESLDAAALAKMAHFHQKESQGLVRAIRGDLDWIVLKCLEKTPSKRYETAGALEADLVRHLQHEPILAHPPSLGYRSGKWLRRKRGALMTFSAVCMGLALGVGISFWSFRKDSLGGVQSRMDEGRHQSEKLDSAGKEREGPTTHWVSSVADSGPGSLRQALIQSAPGDTILFRSELSGLTIEIQKGALPLSKSVEIDASPLPEGIRIDGVGKSRVLEIYSGTTNRVSGITFSRGYSSENGGAVINLGDTTFDQCTYVSNQCDDQGGAIFTAPKCLLRVQNSTFYDNHARITGGAIFVFEGTLELVNSTLTRNTCAFSGGALFLYEGNNEILNCTIVGNSAGLLRPSGGGGLFMTGGTTTLNNSVIADNRGEGHPNVQIALGNYLQSQNHFDSAELRFLPLGNYGGLTWTMPPEAGSRLIDAGTNSVVSRFPLDQRGLSRLIGDGVDIGAVESQ